MKIKFIISVLLVTCILISCTPEANVVPTETAFPTSTFPPNPQTSTNTILPPTQTAIPSATPAPPDINSGYHISVDGLSLYCELWYVAGNSFLTVLPNSCTADGVPNQPLPAFYNSTQWLRVDQPTGMPVDLAAFPDSSFSGYILAPSSVSRRSSIDRWRIDVAGDNGVVNHVAVMIESGEHAGEIVFVNLSSRGPAPITTPEKNNENENGSGQPTEPPDPPPPGETPHG
jgi:hypothetical protein